jgi:hypothetical protein
LQTTYPSGHNRSISILKLGVIKTCPWARTGNPQLQAKTVSKIFDIWKREKPSLKVSHEIIIFFSDNSAFLD